MHFRWFILIFIVEQVFAISESQKQCIKKAKENFEKSVKNTKIRVNGILYDDLSKLVNTSIKTLDISNTEVERRPYIRNSSSLIEFEAASNYLTNFDEIGELDLPNIFQLNFSHNALTNLKYGLFDAENSLEVLDLSFNCLETFHMGHELEVHSNLTHLDLKGNLLKEFKYIPRAKIFELQELDLSFNQLTAFNTFTLIVHKLNLNNNKLSAIRYHLRDHGFFNGFIKLYAQYNEIQRFESPFNFSLLNLSHNSLSSFDDIMISQIMFLDLSHNLIESDEDAVHYSDEDYVHNTVQHLNLEGNQIKNMRYVKCYFPQTEDINIQNNPVLTNLSSNVLKNITCSTAPKINSSSGTSSQNTIKNATTTTTPTSTIFPQIIKNISSPQKMDHDPNANNPRMASSTIALILFVVVLALAGFGFIAYKQRLVIFSLRNDVRFQEFENENEISFNRSPFA